MAAADSRMGGLPRRGPAQPRDGVVAGRASAADGRRDRDADDPGRDQAGAAGTTGADARSGQDATVAWDEDRYGYPEATSYGREMQRSRDAYAPEGRFAEHDAPPPGGSDGGGALRTGVVEHRARPPEEKAGRGRRDAASAGSGKAAAGKPASGKARK